MPFYDIDDATQAVVNRLEDNKVGIGVVTVTYGDERLIKEYPAILVEPGLLVRTIHGTRQWGLDFQLLIWIYHARLTVGRSQRLKEDIVLTNKTVETLHQDRTYGGELIHSMVTLESPGLIARGPTNTIIGTRLTWTAEQVQPW